MFDRSTRFSYAEQKKQRYRVLKLVCFFAFLCVVYISFTSFFFSVWVVESNTMQPGINSGDRIIFHNVFLRDSHEGNFPLDRGSIVLIDKTGSPNRHWSVRVIDSVVRFFTAQRLSLFSRSGQFYLKRVIALPGDEISMNDFIFRVRTGGTVGAASGEVFSLTEFELSARPYSLAIPSVPDLWDTSVPFSGTMDTIILGANEIFVVSDDRSGTNDSRTWGPVSPSQITARAVLRIWPLNKIELF
ncbi:MAG: signal peptidase I [Treponema sp.]|nr:signal peptidase I [Treponema sp.]